MFIMFLKTLYFISLNSHLNIAQIYVFKWLNEEMNKQRKQLSSAIQDMIKSKGGEKQTEMIFVLIEPV